MADITPLRMPKWGLSMQEGTVVDWLKAEGDAVSAGEELFEVETSKITNVGESPASGTLRRIVASSGETLPIGALMGVLAESTVADADIDAFVADFQARFETEGPGEEAAAALTLEQVDIGGRRSLRVGRAGPDEDRPVVLIHGYSGDLNNWLFNIEAIAAKAPVIAIDLPGHGGSTKDVGEGSLDALAKDVGAALDTLGVTRATLVGHSLGAAVAMRLAQTRPEFAKGLVLVSPAYLPGGTLNAEFLDGVVDAQKAKTLKPVLELLVADPAMVSRDMVEDMIKFKRTDGAEEALGVLRDRMVSGADKDTIDLSALPPVHVIASRDDRIVGAPDEAALPPGWRVSWIEGAGHLPHLEKAAEVNALIVSGL